MSPPVLRLLRAVDEFVAHYHKERNHQGLGNALIVPQVDASCGPRGVRVACDFVVVGVGIEPEIPTFTRQSVTQSDGVLVDELCRASAPDVYAAGDVANHLYPVFGRVRVQHYNNAEQMGRAAARSMLGSTAPYDYIHSFWSDQYEHKLEYVGHATKWDQFVVRGSVEERRLVGFYLFDGHVQAAVGLDRGGDPELDSDSEMAACTHDSWALALDPLRGNSQTKRWTCGRWRVEASARPPAVGQSAKRLRTEGCWPRWPEPAGCRSAPQSSRLPDWASGRDEAQDWRDAASPCPPRRDSRRSR